MAPKSPMLFCKVRYPGGWASKAEVAIPMDKMQKAERGSIPAQDWLCIKAKEVFRRDMGENPPYIKWTLLDIQVVRFE